MCPAYVRFLLCLVCLVLPAAADAAAYVFPGNLPSGCSAAGGNTYNCGALTFASGDTLSLASTPATINVSGDFYASNGQINAAGSASNLTLNVTGRLTVAAGARVVAQVTANTIHDSAGYANFVGDLTTTSGFLALGIYSQLTGNALSTSGNIYLWNNSTVTGRVSTGGWVQTYGSGGVTVGGTVTGYGVENATGYSSFGGAVTAVSSYVLIGLSSTVNGPVTAGGGDVNLWQGSRVNGNVQASAWVHVWPQVTITGTTTGTVVDATGGNSASYGGNVTATSGWVNLAHHSTVTGDVTATGGDVTLTTSSSVSGSVTASANVNLTGWYIAIGSNVSGVGMYASGSFYSTYGGNITTTTGGATIGNESTVRGNVTSTTGTVSLQGGVKVDGTLVCRCTLVTGAARVSGITRVETLSDSGASVFLSGVQARDAANLGNGSGVVGDLVSTENSATQGAASSVTGCVKSRTGNITLNSATGTGGVCCGTGTCGSSCVFNFSGHGMPATCASTLPQATAEYRFDESAWTGAANEVKDSSGLGKHATKLASVSLSSTGRLCNSARIPADTTSTSQAVDTGIRVADEIGSRGTIAFWYKASAAWSSLPAGELFDATTASGKSFHLVRLSTGALAFYYSDSWGYLLPVTTSVQTFAANTWVHIAVTWYADLWNGKVQIFINGTATSATPYTIGGIDASLGTLYIGDSRANNTSNSGTVNSANGLIDEFMVYRTVLSSTEIAAIMARTRTCAAPAGTLVAGQRYSFESYDWPGFYVRHEGFLGKVTQYSASPTSLERNDATFIARAGLSNSSCWSFESVNYPGYYLRHSGSDIALQVYSATGTYPADATFCLRAGLADTAAISLESVTSPGSFLYHRSTGFLGIASNDGSVAYAGTATFNVFAPFSKGLDHVEIRHASGTGVTCTPSTVTVVACNDASCTTPYTGGLTGNLTSSGVNVVWPSGTAFSIPSGSSSTTVSLQLTSPGTALLGLSGLSSGVQGSNSCNFGSPACTFTASDAGLVFDVPNHLADVANSVTVAAVRKSDNAQVCVPALASVTRTVGFKCSYANPASGTLPVRVGGVALNAAGNAATACDGTGKSLSLAFDASGVATTSVQYADVGSMTLNATYTGSVATGDAGLTLAGSDGFIAAPAAFAVSVPAGNKTAGASFSATASAKNVSGAITPNFGRESPAEGMTPGWVRTQPQGVGVADGSFSGSFGGFSGSGSASNLVWSEVGRGDLSVWLTSGSYLGSGYTMAGSTAGDPVLCAAEWGICTIPPGATATILYGIAGKLYMRTGMYGNVWCANSEFGDPAYYFVKSCWYVLTSGSTSSTTGAVGRFLPHHLELGSTPACGAFSYAGQPFGLTVRAYNAAGAATLNYDGGSNFTPALAQALTLSESPALGLGSLSSTSVAASAFNKGVATVQLSYAFTQKLTAPQSLNLSAVDADGVASSAVASMALRSGRLVLSNAFGSEKQVLSVPMRLQHWSGKSWILTGDDSCTVVPSASVARGSPINSNGSAATWTSSVSAVSLSGGIGSITLQPPSGGGTGSLDLALNLGSSGVDVSCLASHPASTPAGLPWLRARAGNCASSFDRDPSARATFGVYAPETRKMIHLRELF